MGVGNDTFEAMEALDSDDNLLTVNDRVAERDIVQFVPLKKFLSKDREYIKYQANLAEEVCDTLNLEFNWQFRDDNLPVNINLSRLQ